MPWSDTIQTGEGKNGVMKVLYCIFLLHIAKMKHLSRF